MSLMPVANSEKIVIDASGAFSFSWSGQSSRLFSGEFILPIKVILLLAVLIPRVSI
jgi:hypothetical protein